jgi:hypothetical protein
MFFVFVYEERLIRALGVNRTVKSASFSVQKEEVEEQGLDQELLSKGLSILVYTTSRLC